MGINSFITVESIDYASGLNDYGVSNSYIKYYFDGTIHSIEDYGPLISENYEKKSMTSIDQIFIPIDSSGTINNSGIPSMNGRLYPSGQTLDGAYICNPTRGTDYPDSNVVGPLSGTESHRVAGLRTPIYMAGYGLTREGKPAFNATEISGYSETNQDIIRTHKNNFPKDYQNRPDTWRAGPLDVRWDNSRGVWFSGPIIVEGYAIQDIPSAGGRKSNTPYTSGWMVIYTGGGSNWDYNHSSGNPTYLEQQDKALLINRSLDLSIESGAYLQAMYYPNGELRPFWVDCTIDPSGALNRLAGT